MVARWTIALAAAGIGGCGVRPPPPVDVGALVARRGPTEAHRDLEIRILADPRDVAARLALAELDEQPRPAEAIDELEAVIRLGGPLGTRWRDADRQRLGRLLLARGRARLARGSGFALADLERAGRLGASPKAGELDGAHVVAALAALRHVDADERARGRALVARQWPVATPADRGAFGAWLWDHGARREAYDQLAAWHGATPPPRDGELQGAYLRALAWWSPVDAPPPPDEDLVGPERCRFAAAGCPIAAPEASAPPFAEVHGDPRAAAAAHYAHARFGGALDEAVLLPAAAWFARDPAVTERLGRELVASAIDAAAAHATIGALYDALGDPGRARIEWQAAVDADAEPAFARGLAEAAAHGGDAAAALIYGTGAAAASGDPAVVWASVARALDEAGQHVEALAAAGFALELGGPDSLPGALDVAVAASQALGRTAQAVELAARRGRFAPPELHDPTGALAAYHALPTAGTVARLWVASRAAPRDVELRAALVAALDDDDPRRATVVAELVGLAGDPDPERGLVAVAALR